MKIFRFEETRTGFRTGIFQRRERRERDRSKIARNEDDEASRRAQAEAREMSQPTN